MIGLLSLVVGFGVCLVLIIAVVAAAYVVAQERDARREKRNP